MGDKDPYVPVTDRMKADSDRVHKLYQKLGVGDRFEFQIFDGVHEFNGKLAWAFLKKCL